MGAFERPDGNQSVDRAGRRVLVGFPAGDERSNIVAALEHGGFVVCAESDDPVAAVDAARQERPDLALIYGKAPGTGIVAARDILGSDPRVSVVLLDDDSDDETLFAALEAGVSGVLPPDIDPERLPRILRGVLAGEAAIPRMTMSRVLREFSARSARENGSHADASLLSPRQQEVLALLGEGMSTSEIADALYISRVTVRTHVLAILRRLDLPDRAAAIEYFSGR
jgi:DNA-binding NarL/FixJ family response regulator